MRALIIVIVISVLTFSCVDRDPMELQQRPDAYRASAFFDDGRVMRPALPHTVVFDSQRGDARLRQVGSQDAGWSNDFPLAVTVDLVQGGRARYDVFCSPCHGVLADGNGPVADKLTLRRPPALIGVGPNSLQGQEAEAGSAELPYALGFYFAVLSQGYGVMPSYADVLDPTQRWAVIAYLRALSNSQWVPFSEVSHEMQAHIPMESP